VAPAAALLQGIGCVLCGDLDDGDAFLQDAADQAEEASAHETLAQALAERSLVAMARGDWDRAEVAAGRAGTVLPRAGIEDALVCAVQARVAVHRGDVVSAREHVIRAQRARPLLTHALPHIAVQARIELIRVHLTLTDVAAARTLMREVDALLRVRPGLGNLVGEAQALRTQLSKRRGYDSPTASSLTAAELRLLPLLSTHLTFTGIGRELFLSPNTVKARAVVIYRKLGVSTRVEAVARSRELGLLEG
jgi:LuxR family maltose regulon positive regulatory protein